MQVTRLVPTSSTTVDMTVARLPHWRLRASAPFLLRRRRFAAISTASFSAAAGIDETKWKFGAVSMVQGASRGIGLEFVKQLLQGDEAGHVIATCRSPPQSSGLLHLKNRFSERLSILPLDVTIESSIKATAESIGERYGYLNLLVNASGILSILDILQPDSICFHRNDIEKGREVLFDACLRG